MINQWYPYVYSRTYDIDYTVLARPQPLTFREAAVHPNTTIGCYLSAVTSGLDNEPLDCRRWFFVRMEQFTLFGVASQLYDRVPCDKGNRRIRGAIAFYTPHADAPLPRRTEAIRRFGCKIINDCWERPLFDFTLDGALILDSVALKVHDQHEVDLNDPWLRFADIKARGMICPSFPEFESLINPVQVIAPEATWHPVNEKKEVDDDLLTRLRVAEESLKHDHQAPHYKKGLEQIYGLTREVFYKGRKLFQKKEKEKNIRNHPSDIMSKNTRDDSPAPSNFSKMDRNSPSNRRNP